MWLTRYKKIMQPRNHRCMHSRSTAMIFLEIYLTMKHFYAILHIPLCHWFDGTEAVSWSVVYLLFFSFSVVYVQIAPNWWHRKDGACVGDVILYFSFYHTCLEDCPRSFSSCPRQYFEYWPAILDCLWVCFKSVFALSNSLKTKNLVFI